MAFTSGSYSDQDNALSLFYAWAGTNGWTQNNYSADGTGFRAHISKSIGGTVRYFNLRSGVSEFLGTSYLITRGIAVNGSTAWDGTGTSWELQTGYTTRGLASATATAGRVDQLYAAGGDYYFFATATSLTAVFTTDSAEDDYRMLTIGSVGGFTSYFASGGHYDQYSAGNYDVRSAYCSECNNSAPLNADSASYIAGEGWYVSQGRSTSISTDIMHNIVSSWSSETASGVYGSVSAEITYHSPDPIRGNAQLAPSLTTVKKSISGEIWPLGEVEGVKFVNMTNYTDGQEITYGSDTYKMFRIFASSSTGAAFLK